MSDGKEFYEWWKKDDKTGTTEDIAKRAWNEALRIACENFTYQEGTDYDVERDLKVSNA